MDSCWSLSIMVSTLTGAVSFPRGISLLLVPGHAFQGSHKLGLHGEPPEIDRVLLEPGDELGPRIRPDPLAGLLRVGEVRRDVGQDVLGEQPPVPPEAMRLVAPEDLQFGAGVEVFADLLCGPSELPFLDRLPHALGVWVVVRGQWHE